MKGKKRIALALLVLSMPGLLTGCWDSWELNHLFVVTGLALDVSDQPDKLDLTIQVGNFSSGKGSGGGSDSGDSSPLLLKATGDTVLSGIDQCNQDSNHRLLMQHNQVRLFGMDLAKQGLGDHLDVFLRDPKSRLEIPLLVVDGKGAEALEAKLSQEPISGIFLGGMMTQVSMTSMYHKVRLIDFTKALMEKTTAPVIPIIKVETEEKAEKKEQTIHLEGLAVFRESKMVGQLDNEDTQGYLWALGNIKRGSIEAIEGENRARLNITNLECSRTLSLKPDGGVKAVLSVRGLVGLTELNGFADLKPEKMLDHLSTLCEKTVRERIEHSFRSAQALNADIFGFGNTMRQHHPKEWRQEKMGENWDQLFSDMELSVDVSIHLPLPGQVVQSIEMAKEANPDG